MDIKIEKLDLLRSYILKLVGEDIYEIDELSLSSAQKSRIASWCEDNEIKTPDLNNKTFWRDPISLNKEITILKNESNLSSNNIGISVGVDIQKISEFFPEKKILSKNDDSLCGIYTKNELSYAESKESPRDTLAGIFAAKESIFKCLNIHKKNWSEIEIKYTENKPTHHGFALSISHSGDFAIAIAIKELDKPVNELLNHSPNDRDQENTSSNKPNKNIIKLINTLSFYGGLLFLVYFIFITATSL